MEVGPVGDEALLPATHAPGDPPPAVEHPAVAEALRQIDGLDSHPLAEHHDRLSQAHDLLHAVLNPPSR